jgi:hypothetical protein
LCVCVCVFHWRLNKGFSFARKPLYHYSHNPNLFAFLVCFSDRVLSFCPSAWDHDHPTSVSWVAGNTGVHHHKLNLFLACKSLPWQ